MSKLVELRTKFKAATDELGALGKKDERSADEESRLDSLLAEVNDLGPKLEREIAIEAAGKRDFGGGRQTDTAPTEEAQKRAEAEKKVDRRSLGRRFVESDQFLNFRQSGGRGKSGALDAGSFYTRHQVEHREGMEPEEVRALIQTGGLPADYILPTQVPGFFRGDDLQGTVRDVLINGTTTSDSIRFFRETAFTNAAAAVAQATSTTGATGLKPESTITFEQDSADVVTIAHWVPITRQTLEDASQIRTYVEQRLLDGLRLEESDQLLNGDGTGANMTGILNTTDIQYLDNTVTTGYWAVNPLASVGTDRENFDRILRSKTVVRTTGRARPNFAVLNPADMEGYLMTVDGNARYYGPGPFSGATLPTLWGLRVVEDENIPEGEALVGDGRMAAVWDRMQAQILIDTIDDQFVRNMLTILAEERLALTVFRPQAFAHVELAAW